MAHCKICRAEFERRFMSQKTCGDPICKKELKRQQQIKKDLRAKKQAIKSKGDWLKEAQTVFNQWIRLRDYNLPCISCGRHHHGQWHAGHYISVGARPGLRFDQENVNKQCQPCNTHLSGNLVLYRLGLIEKYGQSTVDRLEGPQEPKKYTIDDLKQIIFTCKNRIKELQLGINQSSLTS